MADSSEVIKACKVVIDIKDGIINGQRKIIQNLRADLDCMTGERDDYIDKVERLEAELKGK